MSDEESNPAPEQIAIPIRQEFLAYLNQQADILLGEMLKEVNTTIVQILEQNPAMENPLLQFNMGQSLYMDIVSNFKRLMEQKEISIITTASTQFMSSVTQKQILQDKKAPRPAGIG